MNMLALTIMLPLIGFVLLAFSVSAGLKTFRQSSALALWAWRRWSSAFIGVDFFANGKQSYRQPLWTWMSVGDLTSV
ncbi:hypothetical protein ACNKHU_13960 [Shigella flexneri]